MKTIIVCAALALAVTATAAEAKGCLKGALVGGAVGHYAITDYLAPRLAV